MADPNKDENSSSQFDDSKHSIERFLSAIFDNAGDPLFIKDDKLRLLLVNNAFCTMFGLPRSEIIGQTLATHVEPSEMAHFMANDIQVLEDGIESISEESLTTADMQTKMILTKKNRFIDPTGKRFLVGVVHDITQRKYTEMREKSRSQVLEKITSGEPLKAILNAIVSGVEHENPAMLCSILLLDEAGKTLSLGTASSLPDFYNEAIDGVKIGPEIGSCGTAAFINERVIVEDIQTHPYWAAYTELAKEANIGSCWSQPIRSSEGVVLGTFAIYHHDKHSPTQTDLTLIEQTASLASIAIEKKRAEEKLTRAASVFTHANEGIMITDASAKIIEVNDSFCRVTGYSPEEVLGQNPSMLQSGKESPEFFTKMWQTILKKGHWHGEIWNRRKNGEVYPEMLTISAVKNAAGDTEHYVSLSTDITANKANLKQLERIAHYDLLTNLPNRVLLAERLNQAIEHCKINKRSLAVAFMDLDGFKIVNDSYGHSVGDDLLIAVSKRMKRALRKGDTLARIGGDEFIAIMVDLDEFDESEFVFERLLKAAADPVVVKEASMQVSASIGVTRYPQDSADAEQLIRHADQAMYMAKQAGKNRYHLFDTAQNKAINTQHKSIENIRTALERDEFVLHYQPKVNMRTGEVIGTEALIRWQHPSGTLVPPLEFLPVIEGHSISLELGEWVIDTALSQIANWQSMGVSLPTSVNISAYQIQQDNFTNRLATLLAAHPDVSPSSLELEILETSALHDIGQVSATMSACHKLGVLFALDDFGTGYSSLTYLKRLPAHLIKIDQSFVRDMLEDTDDLAIVEGVVGLARAFQREVIAEGVETSAHGLALLKLGCELAQGYGIAKPMLANDIPDWIANWKADDSWQV
ncbi:EAL domain-containing protein [Glaciecola sp. SC05]|uniref:bifunctional diguanylate cyclase/phosphodiesterase n=1 Tax=Glaciecola sp. SC05 TaxID=1987355 RepID=UPI0035294C09